MHGGGGAGKYASPIRRAMPVVLYNHTGAGFASPLFLPRCHPQCPVFLCGIGGGGFISSADDTRHPAHLRQSVRLAEYVRYTST